MSAADWIAEQRRVEQAATEGPWEAGTGDGDPHPHVWTSRSSACVAEITYVVPNDYGDVRPDDAVFIAEARTSLPKMRAALEAVLALHEPVAVYAQADECECGNEDHAIIESAQGDDLCWDTPTGEQRCGECLDEDSEYIDYPCPTVAAIAEALGVEP